MYFDAGVVFVKTFFTFIQNGSRHTVLSIMNLGKYNFYFSFLDGETDEEHA